MQYFAKLVLLALCLSQATAAAQRGPANVIVEPVIERSFSDRVEAIGTLTPKERVTLTVNAADRVTALYFEDGERVRQGQTLLAQAQREQLAAIEGAEATVREAASVVERMRPLVADGVVSALEFDQAKRNLQVAKSDLTSVQTQQRNRVLVAPFDGVVGFRQVSVGAYLTPGDVVTTLVDDSAMQLDFAVPATFLTAIVPGLDISATSTSLPGQTFDGEIISIDNEIDPISRSLRVRAVLPNPDRMLKAGLFMGVTLFASPRERLAVPESAIEPLGSKSFVYVADTSTSPPTAGRREVTIGARDDGMVEIIAGLEAGERVITEGVIRVRDGAPIRIKTSDLLSPGDSVDLAADEPVDVSAVR